MRSHRTWLVALVLPLLMASVLVAQGIPTSTILGRVINEGQGLPGVTVIAKSPALQGTRTAVTSTNGDYVFPNLPPGDYTISFTMSGFQTITRNVKANASQQVPVNATMNLAAVAAEAVVVGTSESISTSTAAATTYSSDLLNKLPTGRTMQSGVVLTPGLTQNGPNGISIAGAQSTENLYTVNGVVITDNVRSTATALYIEDAIQETTTSVSSVSAEFGRFTGGVINSITKSGGNTFSGSIRSSLSNDAWASTSAYRKADGTNPQEGLFINKVIPTWEATLGGPIIKDKVWFFGAGRYYDTSDATAKTTSGTFIPYTTGNKELRYEGKLTLTPFQSQTLTGSYIYSKIQQHNYFFPSYNVPDLESIYDRQQPTDLLALNYNGVITSNLFIEAQYSKKKFTFENSGGRNTDLVGGTVIRDLARGLAMNAPIFCAVCGPPETRDNDNYVVKGTWFLSTKGLGSHNIVFGYDDFGGQRMSNNYQSASNFVMYTQSPSIYVGSEVYPVIDESTELDFWPVLELSKGSQVRTRSAFLNDSWRLSNRLSFNIGVRYDKNDAKNQAGQVTSKDSTFSPRLSGQFDVKGDGSLRIGASYAKYVAALQETQAGSGASLAGSPADFYWYYTGPGINTDPTKPLLTKAQALTQFFDWFRSQGCLPNPLAASCTVELAGASIGGVNEKIIGELVSPNAKEYTFSISGNIGTRGTFRADVVRREYADFYDLRKDTATGTVVNPISGATLDLGVIENSNDYDRNYTGLHTQFTWRIGDRLNVGANWTWSHTLGDLVGETSGGGPGRGALHTYPEYQDRKWNSPYGSLSSDQRHRVRAFGTYNVPMSERLGNLSIGFIQSWDTGTPYGAVGAVDSRPYVTSTYKTKPTSVTYYYTARDAFRTPDVFQTDLSLYYTFRIANAVELFITPQVRNLFNSQHEITVNSAVETRVSTGATANVYKTFNPFTDTPTQGPRCKPTTANPCTQYNWNYGPDFGKATDQTYYQTPRYFTLSVGARF